MKYALACNAHLLWTIAYLLIGAAGYSLAVGHEYVCMALGALGGAVAGPLVFRANQYKLPGEEE